MPPLLLFSSRFPTRLQRYKLPIATFLLAGVEGQLQYYTGHGLFYYAGWPGRWAAQRGKEPERKWGSVSATRSAEALQRVLEEEVEAEVEKMRRKAEESVTKEREERRERRWRWTFFWDWEASSENKKDGLVEGREG
jgi:hypothetical protein